MKSDLSLRSDGGLNQLREVEHPSSGVLPVAVSWVGEWSLSLWWVIACYLQRMGVIVSQPDARSVIGRVGAPSHRIQGDDFYGRGNIS